jgi:flavin reductase (DIM6/NTAB) family NADH-FMN oxidoreductase RutF
MSRNSPVSDFSFLPVHAALVSYLPPGGGIRVVPAGWVGIVCSRPVVLSVAVPPFRFEFCREKAFAVNLPADDLLSSASLAKMLADQEADFPSSPVLTFTPGGVEGSFLIQQCPVRMECRLAGNRSRFGQDFLDGEVVAVHMDETLFAGEELSASTRRLASFAKAWNRCLNPGGGEARV